MPARKRNHDESMAEEVGDAAPTNLLTRLRNMWQFASLMQYIFFFGGVMKIDRDLDIEVWIWGDRV